MLDEADMWSSWPMKIVGIRDLNTAFLSLCIIAHAWQKMIINLLYIGY